jgi:16S rRNA (cytosine1402-N4)-methyltransferase
MCLGNDASTLAHAVAGVYNPGSYCLFREQVGIAVVDPPQNLIFPLCTMTPGPTQHVPVLAREVIEWLQPAPGRVLVDGTLGGGGHTRLLAEVVSPGGSVIALDRDSAAVERAAADLRGLPVQPQHANYSDLPELLSELNVSDVDGILLDLGLSSDQLADTERGFSFQSEGPLDLRFDTTRGEPAWRILERLSAEHLADLIYQYGEERYSRRIARRIVERRRQEPIRTAVELARIVRESVPRSRDERIDPATRTFQALRIAVNDELKWLEVALRRLPDCLKPGGRLAVISFHSLEDRMVKESFRDDARLNVLTRRPVRPGEQEVATNPRSRSAKLRVAERRNQGLAATSEM